MNAQLSGRQTGCVKAAYLAPATAVGGLHLLAPVRNTTAGILFSLLGPNSNCARFMQGWGPHPIERTCQASNARAVSTSASIWGTKDSGDFQRGQTLQSKRWHWPSCQKRCCQPCIVRRCRAHGTLITRPPAQSSAQAAKLDFQSIKRCKSTTAHCGYVQQR